MDENSGKIAQNLFMRENHIFSFLARLAHSEPLRPPKMDAKESDVLLELIRENKVPLACISQDKKLLDSALFHDNFEKAIAEEKEEYYDFLRRFAPLNQRLQEKNLKPILIKSPGFFPYKSDNLDVLIAKEGHHCVEAVLQESGFIEIKTAREPFKYLFKRIVDGEEEFAFHWHEIVGWDGARFLDENEVINRAQPIESVEHKFPLWFPSPEDSLLITIAHSLYENKAIKFYDFYVYLLCLNRKSLDWNYIFDSAKKRGWQLSLKLGLVLFSHLERILYGNTLLHKAIEARIRENLPSTFYAKRIDKVLTKQTFQFPFPLRLSKLLWKFLFIAKIFSDKEEKKKARLLVESSLAAFGRITRLTPRKPLLISFSGLDGCGKTTCAIQTVQLLNLLGIRSSYYWNRVGVSPLMKFLYTLVSPITKKKKRENSEREDNRLHENLTIKRKFFRRHSLLARLWCLTASLDLGLRYFFKVQIPLLAGRAVICDRYLFDAIVDIATISGGEEGLWKRFLSFFSRKPDIAFFLSINPSLSYQRMDKATSFQTLEILREQSSMYEKLLGKKNCHILKAEETPLLVKRQLSETLLDYLKLCSRHRCEKSI